MTKMIGNSPFVYDDKLEKIMGVHNPDGSFGAVITNFASLADVPAGFSGVAQVGGPSLINNIVLLSSNTAAQNTAIIQSALNLGGYVSIVSPGTFPIIGVPNDQAILKIPSNTEFNLAPGVVLLNMGATDGYMQTAISNKNSLSNAIAVTGITHVEEPTLSWYNTITVNIGAVTNPYSVVEYIYIRPTYTSGDTTGWFNWIYRVNAIDNSDAYNKKISYITATGADASVPTPTGGLIVYKADSNIRITGIGSIKQNVENTRNGSQVFGPISYFQIILNKIIDAYCEVTVVGSSAVPICIGNTFNSTINNSHNRERESSVSVFGPAYGTTILGVGGENKDDCVGIFTDGSTDTGTVRTGFFDGDLVTNNSSGDIIGLAIDFQKKVHKNGSSRSVLMFPISPLLMQTVGNR